MDLVEALRSTGAVREFQDRAVPREVMARVLDSARFAPNGGNQQASDALYAGSEPMTGEDIANTILWVAELPPHLNINRIELMPVSQDFAGFRVARD